MRILQVYPRTEQGGTERMVRTLAHEWAAGGHEVATWLPNAILPPAGFTFIAGEAYPAHVRSDVVVVHGGLVGAADLGISEPITGVPVVEVIHRCHPAEPSASRYVAVSQAVARVQARVPCTVIPNGVRVGPVRATREQARAALDVDDATVVVARHGRTEIEKGWHWTMATMERVWAAGLRARLLVVGATGGPATAVLRAWAAGRPCDIVDWCDEPAELLVAADIFLETSPNEAFASPPPRPVCSGCRWSRSGRREWRRRWAVTARPAPSATPPAPLPRWSAWARTRPRAGGWGSACAAASPPASTPACAPGATSGCSGRS